VLAAGLIALAAATMSGNLLRQRNAEAESGLTTEMALLLMYVVGAYLVFGAALVGIVVGGGGALLLHLKPQLHGLTHRLRDEDVRAIMQFVLIAFIVLPVLPNRAFGPYRVINPHQIWAMVVLIVGISLAGYLTYRFFGQRAGILVGGLLGGVISSTATTVSFARRTKQDPDGAATAALVVLIASTVVYARVLLEIQVVAPGFFGVAAPRIATLMAVSVLLCAAWWKRAQRPDAELPEQESPAELKPALFFGLLYGGVLLSVEVARAHLGNSGLFLVAGISGLTDMDAITLSTARLVSSAGLSADSGWRMIVVASLSNLLFKTGIVATVGHSRMLRQVAILFGGCVLAGLTLLGFG